MASHENVADRVMLACGDRDLLCDGLSVCELLRLGVVVTVTVCEPESDTVVLRVGDGSLVNVTVDERSRDSLRVVDSSSVRDGVPVSLELRLCVQLELEEPLAVDDVDLVKVVENDVVPEPLRDCVGLGDFVPLRDSLTTSESVVVWLADLDCDNVEDEDWDCEGETDDSLETVADGVMEGDELVEKLSDADSDSETVADFVRDGSPESDTVSVCVGSNETDFVGEPDNVFD